jgi:hypothetical protein
MNLIYKVVGKIFGFDKIADEAWEKFIKPQVDRARSLGIPDDAISVMLQRALDESDFVVVFPGARLRDLIDEYDSVMWEAT